MSSPETVAAHRRQHVLTQAAGENRRTCAPDSSGLVRLTPSECAPDSACVQGLGLYGQIPDPAHSGLFGLHS